MKLCDVLTVKHISIFRGAMGKENLLIKLAQSLPYRRQVRKEVQKLILEREAVSSTGVGDGVALPHTKADIPDPLSAHLAILKHPLEFDSVDGQPVNLTFFLVSNPNALRQQIQLLSQISQLIRNTSFRERLSQSETVEEALQVIEEEEREFAAPD